VKVRLMWKLEDGEGDLAVGPAWIDTVGEDGRAIHTEKAADGEWISRRQAGELAAQHGWELLVDAGDEPVGDDYPPGPVDVRAINRRLRALGIAEEDLSVGEGGDNLQGLWLDRLPGVEPPRTVLGSIVRTAVISRTPAELLESLDLLAPGWRDQ